MTHLLAFIGGILFAMVFIPIAAVVWSALKITKSTIELDKEFTAAIKKVNQKKQNELELVPLPDGLRVIQRQWYGVN